MTEHIWIAIIAAAAPVIIALIGVWRLVKELTEDLTKISTKILDVHIELNGRLDEWRKATEIAFRALGVKEERERVEKENTNHEP